MHRLARTVVGLATAWGLVSAVQADDRLHTEGAVDVRWIRADGEPSYLNGGLGVLRFDPGHDNLQLGRAFVAPTFRLTDTVTLRGVVDAYGDYGGNPVDVSEAYVDFRPFPTRSIRWHARVGAFFMPGSLENRGVGWSNVYSITPSAINTWLGEEFRTLGAEIEARWLGASSGYLGDVGLVGAVYGGNDPAGVVIAARGFALTDRPSTLAGGLGKSPVPLYQEIDHTPGYYGGLSWRHHDRLELRALRYDNRGDPAAQTASGVAAWRTRFSSFGMRIELDAHWTLLAQYLAGDTALGDHSAYYLAFHAYFALASLEWAKERLTIRFDDFHCHQLRGDFGPPGNQTGHAWTFGAEHDFDEHWQLALEYLRAVSTYAPRAELGEAPGQSAWQLQLAARYRFSLDW